MLDFGGLIHPPLTAKFRLARRAALRKKFRPRVGRKGGGRRSSVVLIASSFLIASPKVQGEFKSCMYRVMILFTKFTVFMTIFPLSALLLAL